MTTLKQLNKFLNDYLHVSEFEDSSWNGLQVEGSKEVNKITVAVDSGLEVFQAAADAGADFLLVHHGHFWKNTDPSLVDWKKERVGLLQQHDISLYAAHLPLDAHEEVGNNAQLLNILGVKKREPFHVVSGKPISFSGVIPKGMHINDVEQLLNEHLGTTVKSLPLGPSIIETVAACSGGGSYSGFFDALEKQVDLYITGDSAEIYQTAKDAKMNIVFAGHYATETLGVEALGEVIGKEFDLDVEFLDFPTGL